MGNDNHPSSFAQALLFLSLGAFLGIALFALSVRTAEAYTGTGAYSLTATVDVDGYPHYDGTIPLTKTASALTWEFYQGTPGAATSGTGGNCSSYSGGTTFSCTYTTHPMTYFGFDLSRPYFMAVFDSGAGGSDISAFDTYFRSGGSAPNDHFAVAAFTPDYSTRIISADAPADGSSISGNNVNFAFTFYSGVASTTYDRAGAVVNDITNGQTLIGPPQEDITVSGAQLEYSEYYALTVGHTYTWQPYLFSTFDNSFIYGPSATFSVSSSPIAGDIQVPSFFSGLLDWVETKPPFGFMFEIHDAVADLNASSTPAATLEIMDAYKDTVFHPLDVGLSAAIVLIFIRWATHRVGGFEL